MITRIKKGDMIQKRALDNIISQLEDNLQRLIQEPEISATKIATLSNVLLKLYDHRTKNPSEEE